MLLPNPQVDPGRLARVIADLYGGSTGELEFVPLGEDSWCYRTDTLWVSVRRDEQGHWPGAYELAHRLHQRGWDFVLAPLAGVDGRIVRSLDGYPVVVFPFLQVSQLGMGDVCDTDLTEVRRLLEQVHAADVAADIATEDYRLGFLADLDAALVRARDPQWSAGPFSRRLLEAVEANAEHLRQIRAEAEHLGDACRAMRDRLVLTHGEPSTANVLVHQGKLLLADWGAAMWGQPERDWFHVGRTTGWTPAGRAEVLRFYELRWELSEITEYVGRFTRPHTGDADDSAMWGRLRRYMSN